MKFWIYWFIAVVICSIIKELVRAACGVESNRLFTKGGLSEFASIVLQTIIAYYLFSAFKGDWILSVEEFTLW